MGARPAPRGRVGAFALAIAGCRCLFPRCFSLAAPVTGSRGRLRPLGVGSIFVCVHRKELGIEAKVEVRVTKVLSVSMTELEWRAAIVEPAKLFALVRQELGKLHAEDKPNWNTVKTRRATKSRVPSKKVGARLVRCPDCDLEMKVQGLGSHRRTHKHHPVLDLGSVPDAG